MKTLKLMNSEATYVSTGMEEKPIHCLEYLKLGKYKTETCESVKDVILIKYDLSVLNQLGIKIKRAYIELKVQQVYVTSAKKSYMGIVKVNEEPFDIYWVDWETKPKSHYYETFTVGEKDIEDKIIRIDITGLVMHWITGKIPNEGVTLEIIEEDVCFIISNKCGSCEGGLKIYYESIVCPMPKSECSALQVQVQKRQMEVVGTEERVKYDTILTKSGDKIYYDFDSNEVIIKEKGCYLVEWWISTDGSGDITEIMFALQNKEGIILCASSAPIFVLSQPIGNGVILIDKDEERLQLVNKSGAAVQFANLSIQASLVVVKM